MIHKIRKEEHLSILDLMPISSWSFWNFFTSDEIQPRSFSWRYDLLGLTYPLEILECFYIGWDSAHSFSWRYNLLGLTSPRNFGIFLHRMRFSSFIFLEIWSVRIDISPRNFLWYQDEASLGNCPKIMQGNSQVWGRIECRIRLKLLIKKK